MTCGVDMQACFGPAPRWETYGVPAPSISNFSYEINAGLLRTAIATGQARQRRLFTDRPTTYDLTWTLNTSQLNHWEALVMDQGFSWLYVPMVTGQVPLWAATDHLIRFISNPQVNLLQKDLWEVNITAEQFEIDVDCMMGAHCDTLAECLTKAFFSDIVLPPFPPLSPVDPTAFVAAWGDMTKWPDPNG